MVCNDRDALEKVHRTVVIARLAADLGDAKRAARVTDGTDYLISLMLEAGDQTETFESYFRMMQRTCLRTDDLRFDRLPEAAAATA